MRLFLCYYNAIYVFMICIKRNYIHTWLSVLISYVYMILTCLWIYWQKKVKNNIIVEFLMLFIFGIKYYKNNKYMLILACYLLNCLYYSYFIHYWLISFCLYYRYICCLNDMTNRITHGVLKCVAKTQELGREKKKTETLLFELLPKDVASKNNLMIL